MEIVFELILTWTDLLKFEQNPTLNVNGFAKWKNVQLMSTGVARGVQTWLVVECY